jgi:hypothetical protein
MSPPPTLHSICLFCRPNFGALYCLSRLDPRLPASQGGVPVLSWKRQALGTEGRSEENHPVLCWELF